MRLFTFSIFLVALIGRVRFSASRAVVNVNVGSNGDGQNRYLFDSNHMKRVDEEFQNSRQNSLSANLGYPLEKTGFSDKGVTIFLKPKSEITNGEADFEDWRSFQVERQKNDSDPALPLHVANTARQKCVDGFKADENGICQKSLPPKGEKSFKLRRRKRGEISGQRRTYADIVKYGPNPPPTKMETLTTRGAETLTTTARTPPSHARVTAAVPLITHVARTETLKTVTERAQFFQVTTVPAAKPVTARLGIATTAIDRGVGVEQATLRPSSTAKPTRKGPSRIGDINEAFLSGEKSSVLSQSRQGGIYATASGKKAVDVAKHK